MDSSSFERLVHKISSTVTDVHEKKAWVMDNINYHNQYREDILSSGFL